MHQFQVLILEFKWEKVCKLFHVVTAQERR